jgi:uncharacterized protein YycO
MKKISAFVLIFFIAASIFAPLSSLEKTAKAAVNTSATVPDISGTWTGTITNLDILESESMVFTISQNENQFSGTILFVITHSITYPQDVGKSFTYGVTGTIYETGRILITGDVISGPPEIVSRCGPWDNVAWQLSNDGNTISFNGDDGYGNNINVLLNRGSALKASFKSYNIEDGTLMDSVHMVGGKIVFDPSASAPAETIVRYDWDFGNGIKMSTDQPNQFEMIYIEPERYTVTLTVTDSSNNKASFTEVLDLTLLPGDLILLRTPGYSTGFSAAWNLKYTHVGMYVGKINGVHYMIESALKGGQIKKEGVQLTRFERWSAESGEIYADVVRVSTDDATKQRAISWAIEQLKGGHKYDTISMVWPQIWGTKQLDISDFDPNVVKKSQYGDYYCSELIWAAYCRAGVDLSTSCPGDTAIPPDALCPFGTYANPKTTWICGHHEQYPI